MQSTKCPEAGEMEHLCTVLVKPTGILNTETKN